MSDREEFRLFVSTPINCPDCKKAYRFKLEMKTLEPRPRRVTLDLTCPNCGASHDFEWDTGMAAGNSSGVDLSGHAMGVVPDRKGPAPRVFVGDQEVACQEVFSAGDDKAVYLKLGKAYPPEHVVIHGDPRAEKPEGLIKAWELDLEPAAEIRRMVEEVLMSGDEECIDELRSKVSSTHRCACLDEESERVIVVPVGQPEVG